METEREAGGITLFPVPKHSLSSLLLTKKTQEQAQGRNDTAFLATILRTHAKFA